MKKFLTHFQNNLIASLVILNNIAVLPNSFNPVLNSTDNISAESSQVHVGQVEGDKTSDISKTPIDDKGNSELSADQNENPDISEPSEGAEDPTEDDFEFSQKLIIKAINPGYTIDKLSNVGEFIELQNLADADFELAGYELQYVNSAGNPSVLFTFPEGSIMAGKHLLLRYYKSPDSELADAVYKGSGLAMSAGPLQLVYNGEVIDEVCWTGKNDCLPAFKNENATGTTFRTTLVRDLKTGDFNHVRMQEYDVEFDPEQINLILPLEPDEEEPPEEVPEPQCQGLEFSELLTYYAEDKSEQFIEFFNPTNKTIILDGCKINYKKKNYDLTGIIESGKYLAVYKSELFTMTKNPTNPIILTLLDVNDEVVDEISYGNGQKKLTSYARIYDEAGNESWQTTYAMTPNSENIYQKFRNCEEGKIINEATGNCVKVSSVKSTSSSKSAISAVLAPCPEGKYRNPLTGRCKNIETTSSTLKECAEGYERNPETNRCRKIKTANEGADYALVPNTNSSDKTVFVGIGIVAIIMALGLIYVGLQFRHEIARAARVARERCNHIGKDLFARGFGRNRHK